MGILVTTLVTVILICRCYRATEPPQSARSVAETGMHCSKIVNPL